MANELSVYYPVSSLGSIYFLVTRSPGQVWNGNAFETQTPADWVSYVIPGADSTGSGTYLANFPNRIASGTTVSLYAYRRAGGTAASTDTMIGTELNATWDGTTLTATGGGTGYGLTASGTTWTQAASSTLWGTTNRLIEANSFSSNTQAYLRMPSQGQAQRFWEGYEQLVTSYIDGAPVDATDALARMNDYANTLNAQAEVANEILTLVTANTGTLHTMINPVGTATITYRTFP